MPLAVWGWVGFVVLAAFLVRSWFPQAWGEVGRSSSIFYEGDTRIFLQHAAQLIEGTPINNGVPFHPPGWPFVLSLFFRAVGFDPADGRLPDPASIKAFVSAISSLAVGLTTLLAWRLGGYGPALAVGLLGTFHFGHVVQGTVPNSEALYGLLLVVMLLLALPWATSLRHGSWLRAVGVGILAGCATLVRAEFMLGAVLLGGFLGWRLDRRDRVRGLTAYGVAFVLTILPTTVSNWQGISAFNAKFAANMPAPLPRFAPVTSYGGFNFAHAHHDYTDGGTNLDLLLLAPKEPAEDARVKAGELDITLPVSNNLYLNGYRIGLDWIRDHPGKELALVVKKLVITSGVFSLGYLQDNLTGGVTGTRRRVDQFRPTRQWLWPVHVGLVATGVWLLRRRPAILWLLAPAVVTLVASTVLFFGYTRLGMAYIPVFWVLQGLALAAVARRIGWPALLRGHPGLAVAALGIALLISEAIGTGRTRPLYVEGPRAPDGTIFRDATLEFRTTP